MTSGSDQNNMNFMRLVLSRLLQFLCRICLAYSLFNVHPTLASFIQVILTTTLYIYTYLSYFVEQKTREGKQGRLREVEKQQKLYYYYYYSTTSLVVVLSSRVVMRQERILIIGLAVMFLVLSHHIASYSVQNANLVNVMREKIPMHF